MRQAVDATLEGKTLESRAAGGYIILGKRFEVGDVDGVTRAVRVLLDARQAQPVVPGAVAIDADLLMRLGVS